MKKVALAVCVGSAVIMQGCAAPMQQQASPRAAATDIRDEWDIRISKAELVFPAAQPQDVANGIKDALSQFAIPANLSYRAMPSEPPTRPGAPELKQIAAAIPSPEYVCDGAYAEIAKRPPPVQNAFAFISEGHQVCLYSFSGGVKSYVMYYSIKKMESLTSGLFNGITRAIRGSDEERAQKQLQENIDSIRTKLPNLLVERIEIPGMPVETPDIEAVAALIPPAEAVPAANAGHPLGSSTLTAASPMQAQVEARKNLNAMGMTYHSQQQFVDAIRRNDEVAVQLFTEGGGVSIEGRDKQGKTPLQIAQAQGNAQIVAMLQPKPQGVADAPAPDLLRTKSVPATAQAVDFSKIPADVLADIDSQVDSLNLTAEQRLVIRSNLARQYLRMKTLADAINN